jgi:hypothetical protein
MYPHSAQQFKKEKKKNIEDEKLKLKKVISTV